MRTYLRSLFVAVMLMIFCLPATAFAKPRPNHSNGGRHHQVQNDRRNHSPSRHSPPRVQQCGMTDYQFSTFVSMVQNTTFSRDQLELIKSAASSNSFTVAQVMQTMNLMTFSREKMDVAASMYNSVCDYNNWYMVYSLLDFNSHIKELKARVGQ